jgi:hypothetical protein
VTRPADFPVGSFESRAAARALLDFQVAGESQRINARMLMRVVYVPVPQEE